MPPIVSREEDVPKPGYVFKKPVLRAIRDLNHELGLQDTLVNLNELALRYFEGCMNLSGNPKEFVAQQCKACHNNSGLGVDWVKVRQNAGLYGLAQAYAVVDSCFRELCKEYRDYKQPSNWITRDDRRQLDPLTMFTENLPPTERKVVRAKPEYHLIHFYRLVRNAAVHPSSEADEDVVAAHKGLGRYSEYFIDCYGYPPGRPGEQPYADFALFTRAVKYFSKVLNNGCNLAPSEILRSRLANPDFFARARRCKAQPKKLKTLVSHLQKEYLLNEAETRASSADRDAPRK